MFKLSKLVRFFKGSKLPSKGQLLISNSFNSLREVKILKSWGESFWLFEVNNAFNLVADLRNSKLRNSLLEILRASKFGQSCKFRLVNLFSEQFKFLNLV